MLLFTEQIQAFPENLVSTAETMVGGRYAVKVSTGKTTQAKRTNGRKRTHGRQVDVAGDGDSGEEVGSTARTQSLRFAVIAYNQIDGLAETCVVPAFNPDGACHDVVSPHLDYLMALHFMERTPGTVALAKRAGLSRSQMAANYLRHASLAGHVQAREQLADFDDTVLGVGAFDGVMQSANEAVLIGDKSHFPLTATGEMDWKALVEDQTRVG